MSAAEEPRPLPPFCVNCGYNLSGAVSRQCQECGEPFVPAEWRGSAAELRQRILEVSEAAASVTLAFKIGVLGIVASMTFLLLPRGWWTVLVRIVLLPLGVAAVFLAGHAFRVERIPPWAREYVARPLKLFPAVAAILIGFVVAATALLGPW